MKPFTEMSQSEIEAMNQEDYLAVLPSDRKACFDCKHLYSAVNPWCGSDEAIEFRGTAIPGVIKCTYWEPDRKARKI
jgi:hypothetical protein